MITHKPVLLQETIDGLDIKEGDTVVDGTLGAGGHSKVISQKLGKKGILIGIDQDSTALDRARENLKDCKTKTFFIQENFRNLSTVLADLKIERVNKILLDIGFSSIQVDDSGRGLSFQKDEPLLMTLIADPKESDLTAEEIVNTWDEENIADVLYGFGGERFSRRIAHGIVEARGEGRIKTTAQLVEIILRSVPAIYKKGRIHPATRTFQALRIAVNDELGALKEGLTDGLEALAPNGRLAVITFHSLEDRIAKRFFKEKEKEGTLTILTKKPIAPSREETIKNPRARSAKLRIIQKK